MQSVDFEEDVDADSDRHRATDTDLGGQVSIRQGGQWNSDRSSWSPAAEETIGTDELARRADALLGRIVRGETSITIDVTGAPANFRDAAIADLSVIASTATGYSLLSELVASGHEVQIGFTDEEGGYIPRDVSYLLADGKLKAAFGMDSPTNPVFGDLPYNPFVLPSAVPLGAEGPVMTFPPDVTLFHELVHAYQDMTQRGLEVGDALERSGDRQLDWRQSSASPLGLDGQPDNSRISELLATGASADILIEGTTISPANEYYTENRYRAETGQAARMRYAIQWTGRSPYRPMGGSP